MIDLSNKTALITGGGRGIGREIALRMAEAGCNVAVSDLDLDTARATASDIEKLGRKSLAIKGDVSKEADVEGMFKSFLEVFPSIDILVNNAGVTRDGLLVRMKEADWDLVLNVNLKSAFFVAGKLQDQ